MFTQKDGLVGVIDQPFFNYVVLGLSIFGSIVFDIHPKFVLEPQDFFDVELIAVPPYFLHYHIEPIIEFHFTVHLVELITLKPVFVFLVEHRHFSILILSLDLHHFFLPFEFNLRFPHLLPALHRLKLNSLNHELPLHHKQALYQCWFRLCFKQVGELEIVYKVADHCLKLFVLWEIVYVHFPQKPLWGFSLLLQFVICQVVICYQSHYPLVIRVQLCHFLDVGAGQSRPEFVKLTIIHIELVFLYLHLDSINSRCRQSTKFVKAHRLPAQVRQRNLQLLVTNLRNFWRRLRCGSFH